MTSAPAPRTRQGHVIVCGLGGLGLRVVEQLRAVDADIVIVDERPEPRCAAAARGWGLTMIDTSPRLPETLWAAGLAGASAVIVVLDKDLDGLEVTLLVRELRPDVRTVVRLDNVAVGRAVADVTGPGTVLSVADLAAPSIVEACLRSPVHNLDVPGVDLVSVSTLVEESSRGTSLRDHYGELVPLAVVHADGREPVVCPGRDHEVKVGDRVSLIGTPEALAHVGVRARSTAVRAAAAAEGPGRIATLRRSARSIFTEIDRPLKIALLTAVALVAFSTTVLSIWFHVSNASGTGHHHLSPLDALYFTLTTVTTVGYGDYSFSHESPELLVFGIFLLVAGAATVTTLYALLTNLLVSRRVAASLGQARATSLRDHIVVIGLGSVGVRVVEALLAAGREVVVVERSDDNRYAGQVRSLHVPVVVGDATLNTTLDNAGVPHAQAVAVVTSDDLANIESGLAVRAALKEHGPTTPVVLRVFDRSLGATVEHSFGFRQVQSTADLAAPWFVGSALGLDVLGSFYVEELPFLLGRLTVSEDGGLVGLAMRDLDARIRVVALARASRNHELDYPPRRATTFAPGDQAYLVGPYEEIMLVLRRERQTI